MHTCFKQLIKCRIHIIKLSPHHGLIEVGRTDMMGETELIRPYNSYIRSLEIKPINQSISPEVAKYDVTVQCTRMTDYCPC